MNSIPDNKILPLCSIFNSFDISINNDTKTQMIKIINELNTKFFGIFVTIKNNDNVHGCVGNYNHNLSEMSTDKLLESLSSVSKSATFEDDRNSFKDTFKNKDSEYHVSLMKVISNDQTFKYNRGILVISDKLTATFLPNVYDTNTSEKIIKEKLLEKAKIKNNNSINYYIYDTIEFSIKIPEIFDYTYIIYKPFYNLLLKELHKKTIVYEITNNTCSEFTSDPSQFVRNVSTLISLYDKVDKETKMFIDQYLCDKNTRSDHSDIFVLMDSEKYPKLSCITDMQNVINKKDVSTLEPSFELPQALSVITNSSWKTYYDALINTINNENLNGIFTLNWTSYLIKKKKDNDKKFLEDSMKYINKYYDKLCKSETNFLAVTFECLCNIHSIFSSSDEIFNKLLLVYYTLLMRISECSSFKFSDGKSRVDITFHVLHGIEVLGEF